MNFNKIHTNLSLIAFVITVLVGVLTKDALFMFYAVIFLIFSLIFQLAEFRETYSKTEMLKIKLLDKVLRVSVYKGLTKEALTKVKIRKVRK